MIVEERYNQRMEKLAFVDVETTGSDPVRDRVMELGVLRVENDEVVSKIDTLVNPQVSVPPFIQSMTGIMTKDLSRAPLFDEVMRDLLETLEDCVFVAHNARFDYAFIKHEFLRYDIKFRAKMMCTVRLSRNLYPQYSKHNLDALIKRHGIACQSRHRAFGDALVLRDFCEIAKKEVGKKVFHTITNELIQTPALPVQIEKKFVDGLPDTPGVYVFYGEEGAVLYVGKSVDIQSRVRSHFTNDYMSERDLRIAKQLSRIEVTTTAGELGALLRESWMIKEISPYYNRQLRRSDDFVLAMRDAEGEYERISLVRRGHVEKNATQNIYGVYKSKKMAKSELYKIAEEHNLCPALLGIEPSRTGCFNRQLGKCFGACAGEEKAAAYNIRFAKAFADIKIPRWAYGGVVAIEEQTHTHRETHFVDNWVYLGSIETAPDFDEPRVVRCRESFDFDTYKILKRLLRNPRKRARVRLARREEIDVLAEA